MEGGLKHGSPYTRRRQRRAHKGGVSTAARTLLADESTAANEETFARLQRTFGEEDIAAIAEAAGYDWVKSGTYVQAIGRKLYRRYLSTTTDCRPRSMDECSTKMTN